MSESDGSDLQRRRERKLVRRLLSGDQRAFKEFVDNYFPRLYRYARSRLGDDQAVDDVVQAALSNAALHLQTFRGRGESVHLAGTDLSA